MSVCTDVVFFFRFDLMNTRGKNERTRQRAHIVFIAFYVFFWMYKLTYRGAGVQAGEMMYHVEYCSQNIPQLSNESYEIDVLYSITLSRMHPLSTKTVAYVVEPPRSEIARTPVIRSTARLTCRPRLLQDSYLLAAEIAWNMQAGRGTSSGIQ
jgi:hypothetical protein